MLASLSRRFPWIRRFAVWFAWILGVILLLPLNAFGRVQVFDIGISLIDDSWSMNIPWRLRLGEIAGRDFVYTYGPLYQLTHALGLIIPPGDGITVYRYEFVPECFLIAASIWGLLAFSGAPLRWRVGLYLGWCLFLTPVEHAYIGLRPHGLLWITAACGYLAVKPAKSMAHRVLAGLLWASAVPAFLLYSFDSGAYGLVALLGLGISLLVASRSADEAHRILRRQVLVQLACMFAGFVIFVGVMKVLPGWGRYFRDSSQVASGYARVMALGADAWGMAAMTLSALVAGAAIFWLSRQVRRSVETDINEASRAGAYLGFIWLGLLIIRGGITRSDEAHVVLACVPAIFLLCVIGPAYARVQGVRWPALWMLAFLPFWALLPTREGKGGLVPATSTAVYAVSKLMAASRTNLGAASLAVDNKFVEDGLNTIGHTNSPSVFAWSNYSLFNTLLGKRSPDYTVQSYCAHTTELEEQTIKGLERDPDTVIYFPSYDNGLAGVQSCTRTPKIFRYFLEHYQTGYIGPSGSALLERRPAGQEIRWAEEELEVVPTEVVPSSGQAATIKTRSGAPLCRFGDFLVVSLRCPSSPFLALTKPGKVSIGFRLKVGKPVFQQLALPADGQVHDILVSARTASEPGFLDAFATRPKSGEGPEVTAAGLIWEPLDALSVRPPKIEILKVSRLVPG